jgi:hypothetical protein
MGGILFFEMWATFTFGSAAGKGETGDETTTGLNRILETMDNNSLDEGADTAIPPPSFLSHLFS